MKYAAYKQYKPSRIEWLGDVPEHWEIWKIAHGFQMTGSGTTPPPDNPDWYDGDVCWVTTSELREKVITDTEKKISREALKNFSALKVFPEGALAIAMYGATIGRLGIFGIAAATNQACGVLFGQKSFDTKFVFYWLQAFREQIILLASGGGQPNISQEKVRSIRIACPSIDEQKTIARFLDAKTAQIDALVAQKRQLIAKLKEKRSALIARTVTRGLPPEAAKAAGLEPNPQMKDSGVEWLNEIPVHWTAKTVRYIFHNCDSRRIPLSSEERADLEKVYPYYGASGVIDMVDDYLFDESLILVAEDGANLLSRSSPLAFLATGKYWVNNHAHILKPLRGDIRYWVAALETFDFSPLITGAAQPKLTADRLAGIRLPVPPAAEQTAIADYLSSKASELDDLVGQTVTVIDRLTEYRQAMITSAVTGKIDVRELA